MFWTNHWWTLARSAAKRRDKYRCRECGAAAPKRPAKTAFGTLTTYRTAMRDWRIAKKTQRMEVDHRVPCRGKHGRLSCDHHLDNLETLCVGCHRARTSADRQTRAEVDALVALQDRKQSGRALQPSAPAQGCGPSLGRIDREPKGSAQ